MPSPRFTHLAITLAVGWLASACNLTLEAAEPRQQKPLQVFILAGQSNMQGVGRVAADPARNNGQGSLEYMVKNPATAKRFQHTIDAQGKWVVRDDVWIWYLGRQGGLSVGYGAKQNHIGPEFQFGHVVGEHFKEQVLIIKTAWGGKSLVKDFRPPSAGGQVGPYYTEMLMHIRSVLANLKEHVPGYQGQGYRVAGFGWHQGWNDGLKMDAVQEYEQNMVHLIHDLRKALGVKSMPVVIANSGFGGRKQKVDRRLELMKAQAAVAQRKELRKTVTTVETRDFFRAPEVSPSRQGYHWNANAETYFLIGDAMGEAMKKLLPSN